MQVHDTSSPDAMAGCGAWRGAHLALFFGSRGPATYTSLPYSGLNSPVRGLQSSSSNECEYKLLLSLLSPAVSTAADLSWLFRWPKLWSTSAAALSGDSGSSISTLSSPTALSRAVRGGEMRVLCARSGPGSTTGCAEAGCRSAHATALRGD